MLAGGRRGADSRARPGRRPPLRGAAPGRSDPEQIEGTTSIRASLYYTDCLAGFYRDAPEWGYAGDEGKPIFDEAIEEALCPALPPDVADCFVAGIRQDMYGDAQMIVDYEILGALDDRVLWVGPVPVAELAGCDEDQPHFVGYVSLVGSNRAGQMQWTTPDLALVPAEQDRPAEISVGAP